MSVERETNQTRSKTCEIHYEKDSSVFVMVSKCKNLVITRPSLYGNDTVLAIFLFSRVMIVI